PRSSPGAHRRGPLLRPPALPGQVLLETRQRAPAPPRGPRADQLRARFLQLTHAREKRIQLPSPKGDRSMQVSRRKALLATAAAVSAPALWRPLSASATPSTLTTPAYVEVASAQGRVRGGHSRGALAFKGIQLLHALAAGQWTRHGRGIAEDELVMGELRA